MEHDRKGVYPAPTLTQRVGIPFFSLRSVRSNPFGHLPSFSDIPNYGIPSLFVCAYVSSFPSSPVVKLRVPSDLTMCAATSGYSRQRAHTSLHLDSGAAW